MKSVYRLSLLIITFAMAILLSLSYAHTKYSNKTTTRIVVSYNGRRVLDFHPMQYNRDAVIFGNNRSGIGNTISMNIVDFRPADEGIWMDFFVASSADTIDGVIKTFFDSWQTDPSRYISIQDANKCNVMLLRRNEDMHGNATAFNGVYPLPLYIRITSSCEPEVYLVSCRIKTREIITPGVYIVALHAAFDRTIFTNGRIMLSQFDQMSCEVVLE